MSAPARWHGPLESAATVIALGLAWAAYTRVANVPAYLLPPPDAVGRALGTSLASGELTRHLLFTLANMLAGFALGATLGLAGGFALGNLPRLERWLEGPLLLLQTAPKIALAPLFVIWFGLGPASKVILVASLVTFPVLVGTLVGVRSLDPRLRDLARIIGLSGLARVRRVDLPGALPDVFVGLRIGAVQAVVGAVLGEWMSGKLGLGALMTYASATYKAPLLFGAVGAVVALGVLVHVSLAMAERRLLWWRA